jgi:hypothetical protein
MGDRPLHAKAATHDRHRDLVQFKREGQPSGCSQQEDYLQMCDYSLHNVASRPAKVGDKLVTTKFDFLTRGFAAIGEPNVAVCLLPGTEVAFDCEVERDHPFGRVLPSMQFGKLGDKGGSIPAS